ncbi:unnamed protein product [Symbiodinium sp. CCMP2592]|nr:unnamed protein product [Symbiodinium sp. CCMP2592]
MHSSKAGPSAFVCLPCVCLNEDVGKPIAQAGPSSSSQSSGTMALHGPLHGLLHHLCAGVRRHLPVSAKKFVVKESIRSCGTFFIGVQDRCMYSHTFHFSCGSEPFTTGCTAVVQVKVFGRSLGEGDVLMDISVGQQLLREIMACYDHKNLDQLEEFQKPMRRNTTVEVMAEAVHRRFVSGLKQHLAGELARGKTFGSISKVEVVVKESDVAFAGFGEELDVTSLLSE